MDEKNVFPNVINKYFKFLLDSGFSVYDKVECDTDAFGNGYYRFRSEAVGIEIVLDRGASFSGCWKNIARQKRLAGMVSRFEGF